MSEPEGPFENMRARGPFENMRASVGRLAPPLCTSTSEPEPTTVHEHFGAGAAAVRRCP